MTDLPIDQSTHTSHFLKVPTYGAKNNPVECGLLFFTILTLIALEINANTTAFKGNEGSVDFALECQCNRGKIHVYTVFSIEKQLICTKHTFVNHLCVE